jgi:pimeloyl-ACP methyl ester carboxylesterase
MYGTLFIYSEKHQLNAFESGSPSSSRYVIFLGGYVGGLLSIPYIERLDELLSQLSYTLIQPLFRSSNLQYGWHTIDNDIEDLQNLIDYLIKKRKNIESIILMGHSTGCQGIIHYLRQEKKSNLIHGIILQGPVSDRQYLSTFPITKTQLEYCEQHRENGHEWLPRSLHSAPITIKRFLSLNTMNSNEDFFSSDLSDEQLRKIYENISLPIMLIWSGEDEYVPDAIKEEVENFIRDKLAMKIHSKCVLLEESDHDITDEQHQVNMINQIGEFIQSIRA